MKLSETPTIRQAITIFIFPTIKLYLLAYRIMGKRCTYRPGNFDVTPLEPITRNEYLFTRLFPATILIAATGLVIGISYLLGLPIK